VVSGRRLGGKSTLTSYPGASQPGKGGWRPASTIAHVCVVLDLLKDTPRLDAEVLGAAVT
jgi:hypothetical protein